MPQVVNRDTQMERIASYGWEGRVILAVLTHSELFEHVPARTPNWREAALEHVRHTLQKQPTDVLGFFSGAVWVFYRELR